MTEKQMKINREVIVILKEMDLIEDVPKEIVKEMENHQDLNWKFEFDDSLPLEEQNVLEGTKELLSALYIEYICKNEIQKESLKQIYKSNDEKVNNRQSINFQDVIEKNRIEHDEKSCDNKILDEEKSIQTIEKDGFLKSFFKMLKKLFHCNKK